MQEIHALCQSASDGVDLSRLLSSYAPVRVHQEVGALSESVQAIRDAIVVVDFRYAGQVKTLHALRVITDQVPHFPIVGRIGSTYETFGISLEALERGMSGLWIAGIEDGPGAVRRVFDHAVARAIGRQLMPTIKLVEHDLVRHFLEQCFQRVMTPLTVAEMATRLQTNGRTLSRALHQSRLPRAEALMVSARTMVATRLLQNSRRRVASVAAAMAVRDVKVFRRQLARLAGAEFVKERNVTAYPAQLAQWVDWVREVVGRQREDAEGGKGRE